MLSKRWVSCFNSAITVLPIWVIFCGCPYVIRENVSKAVAVAVDVDVAVAATVAVAIR